MSSKLQSILKNNDFIVGVIFLLFGVVLRFQILGIKNSQSRIFPYVTLVLVIASGITLLIQAF